MSTPNQLPQIKNTIDFAFKMECRTTWRRPSDFAYHYEGQVLLKDHAKGTAKNIGTISAFVVAVQQAVLSPFPLRDVFESEHPDDDRPRKTIELSKKSLTEDVSNEDLQAAANDAYAAYDAAYAAYTAANYAYAAYTAAYAA